MTVSLLFVTLQVKGLQNVGPKRKGAVFFIEMVWDNCVCLKVK